MYQRKLSKALDHREVRNLSEAVHFAEKRGEGPHGHAERQPSSTG